MNRTIKATAIAIALMGTAGVANAGSATDNLNVRVQVAAGCDLHPAATHSVVIDADNPTASETRNFAVTCNDQLPYVLEIGTTAGGRLIVKDASTSKEYQVAFKQGATNTAWGTTANGESYAGTGNGVTQLLPYILQVNMDDPNYVMQVGHYEGTLLRTLSWTP